MDQPLWQNWLNIAFIGFVARRAGLMLALQWDNLSSLVRAGHVAVLVGCAFALTAVWMSTRWVIGSLCTMTGLFVAASLLEFGAAGVEPVQRMYIVMQLVIALAGTAALVTLARRTAYAPHS